MNRKPFSLPAGLARLFYRFRRDGRGVAVVEFALIVPVLLLLYVGSAELSQLITADSRVATVSGTVGDLVARAKTSIAKSEVDDYFAAAKQIMTPFPTGDLAQVVSLLQIDKSTGTATVLWSRASNGTARAANSTVNLPAEMTAIARSASADTYLVLSETRYAYLPLLGLVFQTPFTLAHQNFYIPRFAASIGLT